MVAVYPNRTKYPKGVKPPSTNMLKPGTNNAKLGGYVTAKKWQGMAMYSLTLEERKTCPSTCEQWDNCFLPGTRVLTVDGYWVAIETLKMGDIIAGFDEEASPNQQRKTKWVTVEALAEAKRPSVKITTDKGTISTAEGHLFLARKNRAGFKWYEAGELTVGHEIKYIISPWAEDRTYEGGRIRGFVEGEGTVGTYDNNGAPKSRLSWAQVPGTLNNEINEIALAKNFNTIQRKVISGVNNSDVIHTDILGGWREVMRFLGTFRPTRLFSKFKPVYEDHGIDGRGSVNAAITAVTSLGEETTIMIKTSSKTLVAEGFAAHNCYGNNMPFAHRFDHTAPNFYTELEEQLDKLSKKHAGEGYVIRLHVLGDFFDSAYVGWWSHALWMHPDLHAFGYTHHDPQSVIGKALDSLNTGRPDRWQIRFSDDSSTPMSAHVVQESHIPVKGAEVICPEQQGKAASCAACGLCWSAPTLKILFIEH